MNKLTLNVEALVVESFDTGAGPAMRGTVEGRAATLDTGPCYTIEGIVTCNVTCDAETGPCVETCDTNCGGTTTGPHTRGITCEYTAPALATCCQLAC